MFNNFDRSGSDQFFYLMTGYRPMCKYKEIEMSTNKWDFKEDILHQSPYFFYSKGVKNRNQRVL